MQPLEIRAITDIAGCVAVEELEMAIWGMSERDIVPAPLLLTAASWGGVLLGAFDGDRLVGFCYGFVGLDGSTPVVCSHMLAVLPEHQSQGVGERLKRAQADAARERGIDRIVWTFDPLESRNAYVNLHKLGAVAAVYKVNHYGEMDDDLNRGLPTDRLLADWRVGAASHGRLPAPDTEAAPVLNSPDHGGDLVRPGQLRRDRLGGPAVRVAIPEDVGSVKRIDRSGAREWRFSVREAFEEALNRGYTAVDLQRGPGGVSFYVLAK